MFSTGKTPPRPKSRTLAKAGTNWVVVTKTLTWLVRAAIVFRHLQVSVSQLSVCDSISDRNWSHWSRLAAPNKPPTLKF